MGANSVAGSAPDFTPLRSLFRRPRGLHCRLRRLNRLPDVAVVCRLQPVSRRRSYFAPIKNAPKAAAGEATPHWLWTGYLAYLPVLFDALVVEAAGTAPESGRVVIAGITLQ